MRYGGCTLNRIKKKRDNSVIEKNHLKFCKRYLEVNNKASNLACSAERGRLPLIVPINQKIMKYFVYLNNRNNSSIVKQALHMSKNLHFINNSGFQFYEHDRTIPFI